MKDITLRFSLALLILISSFISCTKDSAVQVLAIEIKAPEKVAHMLHYPVVYHIKNTAEINIEAKIEIQILVKRVWQQSKNGKQYKSQEVASQEVLLHIGALETLRSTATIALANNLIFPGEVPIAQVKIIHSGKQNT